MFTYNVAGLSVRSEIELPGTIVAGLLGEPDVVVHSAGVPEALEAPTASGPTWEIAGGDFLFSIPEVARFLIRDGREIRFDPAEGVAKADLAIFLSGTVFGILLHQRRQIVLHASGVRVNGKAVLFCGPSGAGKSTLAAALSQRGYALVTDDVCTITFDGTPTVQPDGRQLKLWEQSVKRLGMDDQRRAQVRGQLQKFYVEPEAAHETTLPVGAVYGLREARPPHAPGIERPNVVDAVLLLRSNAYRPLMVNRMGQKELYFQAASSIAGSAGIFTLARHLDFSLMDEVIGWLEAHWREIGLLEAKE